MMHREKGRMYTTSGVVPDVVENSRASDTSFVPGGIQSIAVLVVLALLLVLRVCNVYV